jgi:hypothetical protein
VKSSVVHDLKEEKAKSELEEKAKEVIAQAKTPADLKAAAEKLGLEAKAEANYKLGTPLADLGSSSLLDEPLFAAKVGQVLNPAIFLNGNYLVIGVTKRTDADLTEFAKQRTSLMETAQTERRDQVFGDYVANLQDQMKRDGKIKIYKEVLDQLQEEEPDIEVPGRPRAPTTK